MSVVETAPFAEGSLLLDKIAPLPAQADSSAIRIDSDDSVSLRTNRR